MTLKQAGDADLLELIVQQNEAALAELYDRYSRLIFSVAMGVVGHRATAEEITLDVFVRVWEKADGYRARRAKVITWMTRIARNRAIDILRREEVRPLKHSVTWANVSPEPAADHNPVAAVERSLDSQRIRAALATLPEEQQEVLALAYFQGYTHRQIAEFLDLPLGTVKGRIRLGMQKLRRILEQ
ncbi:MAG: sigma-70 family RNA polymerase sigma factor [Candidatus Promineifilaceae bacterium]|nr:sigma-70 family RNA polymerase sigma factor [Candidatus Promineifilaceae bacterium]